MIKNTAILKLQKEFDENINSHVFLVETNNIEKCIYDIKELIKHVIADNNEQARHQIDEESYLELIHVKPDGKDIKKDQIMELQNRIRTAPILSNYIVYIISHAETMNDTAANKLLKTIEEPHDGILGFLITTNIDIILPTIKSRCEQISAIYEQENYTNELTEEILNVVGALIKAIEDKDHIKFYKAKTDKVFIKDNYKLIENLLKDYYNTACNLKKADYLDTKIVDYIKNKNSYEQLIKKTKYINKTFNKLITNMNEDLLMEKIYIELKGV